MIILINVLITLSVCVATLQQEVELELDFVLDRLRTPAALNSFFNVRIVTFFACSSSRSRTKSRFKSQSGAAAVPSAVPTGSANV